MKIAFAHLKIAVRFEFYIIYDIVLIFINRVFFKMK